MTIDDIKIDINPSKGADKTTLAYINLTIPLEIDGHHINLKINNFRIMTDSYSKKGIGYRLVPPSIKVGFKYKEIVFFEGNKEFWFDLESKILKEYGSNHLSNEMN